MQPMSDLHLGDLEDFTARRNALAKELAADGDRAGADEVRALKKPSRVAWALNRARAQEPKRAAALLKAAEGLAGAQAKLLAGEGDAAALRKAAEREQQAVEDMLAAALAIAEEAGAPLNRAAAERARQTLHAVALDKEVREEFDQHRLTTHHEAAALGGLAMAAAGSGRRPTKRTADRKELKAAQTAATKAEVRREDAERALEEAEAAATLAQRQLADAKRALEDATAEAKAARERVARLSRKEG